MFYLLVHLEVMAFRADLCFAAVFNQLYLSNGRSVLGCYRQQDTKIGIKTELP